MSVPRLSWAGAACKIADSSRRRPPGGFLVYYSLLQIRLWRLLGSEVTPKQSFVGGGAAAVTMATGQNVWVGVRGTGLTERMTHHQVEPTTPQRRRLSSLLHPLSPLFFFFILLLVFFNRWTGFHNQEC